MGAEPRYLSFFFFNDTATTEIYTLSLHDALPIYGAAAPAHSTPPRLRAASRRSSNVSNAGFLATSRDRKSTRLNSSHGYISYAVFCLKKKQPHMTAENKHTATVTPKLELKCDRHS